MSEVTSGTIVDPAKYRGKVLGAAIAGYAFDGFDIMVYALTVPVLFKDWFAQGFNIVQAGAIGTAMLIGMSLGGYIFGPIADKFGRRKGMIWNLAFFGITTGLTAFAQDYIQLGALRFLAGLGLGAEYALGGTMVAEFFPPEKRGKLSSWVQNGLAYWFWCRHCCPVFHAADLGLAFSLSPRHIGSFGRHLYSNLCSRITRLAEGTGS